MDRKDIREGSRNEYVPDNWREIGVETAEEKKSSSLLTCENYEKDERKYVPSHDPGFSVKVATSRGLSSFKTPNRMLYSPVTVDTAKAQEGIIHQIKGRRRG